MKIVVNQSEKISTGDIIEFDHFGSKFLSNFYMICKSRDGYFIINFSGEKTYSIKYYKSIDNLIKCHKENIVRIYSKKEWQLKIERAES